MYSNTSKQHNSDQFSKHNNVKFPHSLVSHFLVNSHLSVTVGASVDAILECWNTQRDQSTRPQPKYAEDDNNKNCHRSHFVSDSGHLLGFANMAVV